MCDVECPVCEEPICERYEYVDVYEEAPPPENITVYDHNVTIDGVERYIDNATNTAGDWSASDKLREGSLIFPLDERTSMFVETNANETNIMFK